MDLTLTSGTSRTATFTMNGVCDAMNFYIAFGLEIKDANFGVRVGTRDFSTDLYTEYDVKENGTHMMMTVPFLAQDVVFEVQRSFTLHHAVICGV